MPLNSEHKRHCCSKTTNNEKDCCCKQVPDDYCEVNDCTPDIDGVCIYCGKESEIEDAELE